MEDEEIKLICRELTTEDIKNHPKFEQVKHILEDTYEIDARSFNMEGGMMEDETEEEWGDLVLIIHCRKCNAMFDLNAEAVACALITHASVWDFIKYTQKSKCRVCSDNT